MPLYDHLIDPMVGLIRKVRQLPNDPRMPREFVSYATRGADLHRVIDWPADGIAGADGLDHESTRLAAIGEFVERYCGNFVPSNLRQASWNELLEEDVTAVDPDSLALYSQRQYDLPGFPFEPFTRDLRVRWAKGRSLVTQKEVWVPASMIWVNYIAGEYADEPATNFQMFSGLAAGATLDSAYAAGLRELLERDATMMWWLADYPGLKVELDSTTRAGRLVADSGTGIQWSILQLPSDFGVPVAGALLVDERDGIAGMGFGCRGTLEEAVLKAMGEAIQLHRLSSDLVSPNGAPWRAMAKGVIHDRSLKPYDPSRGYLEAFDPNFKDVTDLIHHSQIYLDRRLWPELDRIRETAPTVSIPAIDDSEIDESLERYVSCVSERGYDVIGVDVTTDDIAAVGLHAVRVVVPGLLPNGPAGFPFLGGDRLYRVPLDRGWSQTAITEETLNLAPLPHS